MVRYSPLVLSSTQAHLCDTPFCNISRDNCAIPHKKQARKSFAIRSLQVSFDMKSIAAGPLSLSFSVFPCFGLFGGPKIPRCWGKKQHEKSHCYTPFLGGPSQGVHAHLVTSEISANCLLFSVNFLLFSVNCLLIVC